MILILGTAQLGLKYGIVNKTKMDFNKSINILKLASENNIKYFDTARDYGDSEYKLGVFKKKYDNGITIITKINIDMTDISGSIDNNINTSLKNLQSDKIDILLLHKFEYLLNSKILDKLLELKNKNKIKNIGVSVYTPEEAIISLKNKHIKYLQIPLNIIDQRWNNPEFEELIKKRDDVFVCVRSIFLQGILINNFDKYPKLNCGEKDVFNKLNTLVEKLNFTNKTELCISYVKSVDWIKGCIFGVDNETQLLENINLFNYTKKIDNHTVNYIKKIFANIDNKIIDPRMW
jgi:aryl-alcohol dehydrogenase-like predicted oxidoreductase